MFRRVLVVGLSLLILQSCLTYYQRNIIFNEQYARQQFSEANNTLDNNKVLQKPKNRLLYLFDKGVTLQMMGEYEESNKIFEEAYIFIDDFQRNVGREALSLVTNDMARDYGGEDFEKIFIHYYKALNYIMLGQQEEAMVEARRINIKLNEFNDKYKSENKYKRDAFAHILMALLYEASGDENNAFIAYRNSYEIYSTDYKNFFNMQVPEQLKKDLIRTAGLNGFTEDQKFYEKEFGMDNKDIPSTGKELIFLWHNGLGPVKDEWSINFILVRGQGGLIVFENKELGLSFSFYSRSQDEYNSLGDLKVIRVAFPKYTPRKQVYTSASVFSNEKEYKLQMLEDLDEIAIKSLHDRMLRELSKTLLRTALKQAAEQAARKENEGFGAMVSVLNAVTEKADTRNWQTLPGKIYYNRVPLESDTSQIEMATYKNGIKAESVQMEIQTKGKMTFKVYHSISLESLGVTLSN